MNKVVKFIDLGLIGYQEAWDYQEKLFDQILRQKSENRKKAEADKEPTENHLLFCEHPHVFTIGKSGSEANLLVNKELLDKHNAQYFKINRGGDITYHGPGQIVGYPILDLENFNLGVKDYIYRIEESIIRTLKEYGISSSRLEEATGVWLDGGDPLKARKICAIGVRASRFVTMHGFAFNVNTDLSFYNLINPCGFTDKGVTSMEKELGEKQDMNDVKDCLRKKFAEVFDINYDNQQIS